ncbi:hypothetical protein DFP72DRAFT_1075744 [Ephemerocybe angulata]|uniref:Uncharacterized protein n=1 Tax=Ephemerocybe angulata TaxID=980116 RepID=A0A8H6HJT1_9AGAR|nr:hypothetical protein DFP72DRAFT_1075744 [Tulosesus angulatus]
MSSSDDRSRSESPDTDSGHRTNLKFWLEAKQRRQRSTASGSPASIVTTSDEVPRDDRRTDPTYRGRTSARSRIGTVQSSRENLSPVTVRRAGRVRSHSADAQLGRSPSPLHAPETEAQDGENDRSDGNESVRITPPPPVPRALILRGLREARSKRAKAAAAVNAGSDYQEQSRTRKSTSTSSKKRGRSSARKVSGGASRAKKARLQPRPFPMRSPSPLSSDVEMRTALDIVEDAIAERRRGNRSPSTSRAKGVHQDQSVSDAESKQPSSVSRTPSPDPDYIRTYFFDDEVEDDEGENADSGDENMLSANEYDLDDPFIDDTANNDSDASMADSDSPLTPPMSRAKGTQTSVRHHDPLGSPFKPKSLFPTSRHRNTLLSKEHQRRRSHAEGEIRDNYKGGYKTPPQTPSKPSNRKKISEPTPSLDAPLPRGGLRMSTGGRAKRPALKNSTSKMTAKPSPSKTQRSTKPVDVVEISSDESQEPANSTKDTSHDDVKPSMKELTKPKKDTSHADIKPSMKPKPRPVPKAKRTPTSTNVKTENNSNNGIEQVDANSSNDEKPPVVKKNKGKGKALMRTPSPPPLVEDDLPSDGELSPHEKRQIQEAIRQSKATAAQRQKQSNPQTPGGSSSSSGSSTAHARASDSASTQRESGPVTMQELVARTLRTSAGTQEPLPTSTSPVASAPGNYSFAHLCTHVAAKDQTLCAEIQDPVLIATYKGLDCLECGRIIPWTDTPGKGFISFSAWADWIPKMNGGIAFAAVTFRESGAFKNPARASPVNVGLRLVPGTNQRFNMYCATNPPTPFIGVSSGWCDRSQLTTSQGNGLPQRYVIMIHHNQEFQRTVGFIRMTTGHAALHSQFAHNGWQYSTRAGTSKASSSPGDSPGGKKRSAPAGMFKAAPGDVAQVVASENFSLPSEAQVPVYDARGLDTVDFNSVLPKLADSLPLYTGGEIPYGSFIVVGYTMTIYRANNGNWTLGNNIQWVIIVGIPDSD